eukprot:CAMPEP_0183744702 /NCGR_PEP_ID=MMETSP0737-20130205/65861_1 /TAXON_ID=385413 /ORGANISM="Thalassiosira miniscula, Strain CCMP1093" /LENGTH=1616 /DNA_ID=CAMNT_0025980351 /DNA_START=90 /DNA_END=4940 /DNA_ORIENTATION=-
MTDSRVWVSTSAIDAALSGSKSSRGEGHRRKLHVRGSIETINWGWTSANIIEGICNPSGEKDDGQLEDVKIQVDDPESEFHRKRVVIPGTAVKGGAIVTANYHGDEDTDSSEDDGGSSEDSIAAAPQKNMNGDLGCGYPDDLITLTHLHEPAVVHCLRKRYERDKIYTNTGPILIVLNPFKNCKHLYADKIMKQYWERGEMQAKEKIAAMSSGGSGESNDGPNDNMMDEQETLSPHVYALADATYRSMICDMEEGAVRRGSDGRAKICDQSILISGESGAGKTFNTRVIMQYLATLSQRRAASDKVNKSPTPRAASGKATKKVNRKLSRGSSEVSSSSRKGKNESSINNKYCNPIRAGSDDRANNSNQSILISGESGAGKTFNTRVIMKYLATLSQRRASSGHANGSPNRRAALNKLPKELYKEGSKGISTQEKGKNDSSIEQQVLQSNPILESFGNARTMRNDNSSRFGKFIEIQFASDGTLVGASIETYLLENQWFGKFIEIQFASDGTLVGASIETYLLEKVRLISQAEGERNYHVFYEMLAGMPNTQLKSFHLGRYSIEDFHITSCSGTYDRRDGVQDKDTYKDLVEALDVMGFSEQRKKDLFSIASAMLHLSNLTINPINGGEESEIDGENEHLNPTLDLLGVTKESLNQAICYFKIQAGGQFYTRCLKQDRAERGLQALIKTTYSAMFDFIVEKINSSIMADKGSTKGGKAFIGVLDIFGFESFKHNSFEQLCINYCNESLQQQFNLFVLKNEQEEYELEGIQWSFISFPDNQDALNMIWKKGYGMLNILDDQCRTPGTTDRSFANNLYKNLSNKPRFEANHRQVGACQFGVHHYAGLVEYDTEGFVEKNKDELPREATDLLLTSSNLFVRKLASIIESPPKKTEEKAARSSVSRRGSGMGTPGKKKNITVGGHFASQLQSLREKIDLTSPHYVRCLKPNDQLVCDCFDPLMVVEQLRCAGVVEAVRVSRVGYPQRYTHAQFVSRYRIVGLEEMKKMAAKKSSSKKIKPVVALIDVIVKKMAAIADKTLMSASATIKNKKKSCVAWDNAALIEVGIQIGKTKIFLRQNAFDTLENMRRECMIDAAIKVQAYARGYIYYRHYHEMLEANVQLQCWTRVIFAIRKVRLIRENLKSKRIQTASDGSWDNESLLEVGIQIGKTKIFLRQNAFDTLEKMRRDCLSLAATILQTIARGYIYYRHYHEMLEANVQLQCWARVIFAKRTAQVIRGNLKSKRIQTAYRRHRARTAYLGVLAVAKWCQRRQRGAHVRAKLRHAATVIQCRVRIWQASVKLKKLKSEARRRQRDQKKFRVGITKKEEQKEPDDSTSLTEDNNTLDEEMGMTHPEDEITNSKDMLMRVALSDEGSDSLHQKYKSRGICAMFVILLVVIGALSGVLVKEKNNNNYDASYMRGGGGVSSERSSQMFEVNNTMKPTMMPSILPATGAPSASPTAAPSHQPTWSPTHLCPEFSKRFDLTLQLGEEPSKISWEIFDSCSLETFLACTQCYGFYPPNYPVVPGGCLPTRNDSNGRPREYILQISGLGDHSHEISMKWDGKVTFDGEAEGPLHVSYFGEKGGCTESPSYSLEPTQSPSDSIQPTDAPTKALPWFGCRTW